MKRIGITGGMGCGKSTVVAEFEKLGVGCFVADQVAAAYYAEQSFLEQIRTLFGEEVFRADGTADKRQIAQRVFSDGRLLEQLNGIVHPRVIEDFEHYCEEHASDEYVLFESAILYEHRLDRLMDGVICVYLDLPERIRRLRLRDGAEEEVLLARIHNQMPAEEVLMRADYVILNHEGNPRQRQVAYIDRELRKLKAKK